MLDMSMSTQCQPAHSSMHTKMLWLQVLDSGELEKEFYKAIGANFDDITSRCMAQLSGRVSDGILKADFALCFGPASHDAGFISSVSIEIRDRENELTANYLRNDNRATSYRSRYSDEFYVFKSMIIDMLLMLPIPPGFFPCHGTLFYSNEGMKLRMEDDTEYNFSPNSRSI